MVVKILFGFGSGMYIVPMYIHRYLPLDLSSLFRPERGPIRATAILEAAKVGRKVHMYVCTYIEVA